MARQALVLGMLVLIGSCTSEHRTVVMSAADPCTSYGFTASSADYVRCQQMIADRRRAGRMAAGYSEAMIVAEFQAACASYGIARGSGRSSTAVSRTSSRPPAGLTGGANEGMAAGREAAAIFRFRGRAWSGHRLP